MDFLKVNIFGIEKDINLEFWIEGIGILLDVLEFVFNIYFKIVLLVNEFKNGRMLRDDEVVDWGG